MIFHRIHLMNFCQHRNCTIQLTPGLNMLVGPNGSGKTNILRAMQFALTGDAGGDRTKQSDVYQGAPSGEPSFVEAELSHSGAHIVVRRSLRPAENLLTIGDSTWTSVTEINNELQRRLGATKRQIADYIFVHQRKIDEMFDQRPAERAASLAGLFGMTHAEKVHKQVGEFLKHVEVPTTTMDEDALSAQVAELVASVAAIDVDIAALDMPADPAAALHKNQRIIQRRIDERSACHRAAELRRLLTAKETELTDAAAPLYELDGAIADLETGLKAIATECEDADEALHQWTLYHAAKASRDVLDTDVRAFEYRWSKRVSAAGPPCDALTEAELADLHGLENRRAEVLSALRDTDGSDVCHACGQKLPGAAQRKSRKTQLEDECALLEERIPPLVTRRDSWARYEKVVQECDDAYQKLVIERKQLDVRREAMEVCAAPEMAEVDVRRCISERYEFQKAVTEFKAKKDNLAMRLSVLEGEVKQLTAGYAASQKEHNALQPWPTQAQYEEAQNANALILEEQRALEQLNRRRAVLDASATATQRQLDDVRSVKVQGQKTREVVDHLTNVRTVFHREEAPRMVSYTYVEQMLTKVNEALDMFEAPYRVEMDEHLGFTARFLDGIRVQPDRQLSVGERIVLAMAFRITVNSTFAGQVGVLIMDEPTAGLDEHNLGSLPRALDRLRDLSHECGLQVLFVTHEPRISHHFDNAIELPAV